MIADVFVAKIKGDGLKGNGKQGGWLHFHHPKLVFVPDDPRGLASECCRYCDPRYAPVFPTTRERAFAMLELVEKEEGGQAALLRSRRRERDSLPAPNLFMLTIKRKTLLYKSGVGSADYCINHVEGCSHGCNFPCYAMLMKKMSGKIKDYNDWIKPKLVENTLELLEKELPRLKNKIQNVHLCFTTDPFMYKQPEVSELTLKIIERLNKEGIKWTTLTKGIYPKELADTEKYGKNNNCEITIISLDESFRKRYEPFTAPYEERIEALRYLHDRGLKTHVVMEPYPTPNFVKQNLKEILEKIKFVDKIIFGKLNYNKQSDNYPGVKEFYQKCADEVKNFCEDNKIECHIRYGTSEKEDKDKEKQTRKLNGVLPLPI